MKISLKCVSALLVAFALAGCASNYVIATKDGGMILTQDKPQLDKKTGLIKYTDEQGNERQLNADEITQVIKR